MNYNVTIVYDVDMKSTHIVAGHRAAVEHLLGDKLHGPYPLMRIDGDGALFMPIKPRSLASLRAYFDIDAARLAEAIEIDAAMHAQRIDDRLDWQKQEDEDFAQAEAETDHRRGFEWMNKP